MIPAPGRHGGDGPAIARQLGLDPDRIVDLSMTLNPFAPDIAALARRHLSALRQYPDVTHATAALAHAIGIDPARLLLTNGGSEAITLVSHVLGGTVAAEPEFSLHPRGDDGPRWRSNPNNPTGRLAGPDEHADVWDEAFFPLATGRWTRGDDDGAVVVGSLTKLFACPGLRLGYALSDDVERFAVAQPAWSVNGLALALLPELLDAADLDGWRAAIAVRREQLAALLRHHDIDPQPSDAPWLIAEAPGLRERLAPSGVVVRDCASFGLPGHVRIGVPDDDGLARLAEALSCAGP
jgi:histidinol-phosphate/aromatic aminotransferase/cobyric acid decarboxylase-like protein